MRLCNLFFGISYLIDLYEFDTVEFYLEGSFCGKEICYWLEKGEFN